jgi:hypothetical protein
MSKIESWEKQKGETSLAFAAFMVYRDFGPERNIKKALRRIERDEAVVSRKYRTWRFWATRYHWIERAADYDSDLDRVTLAERRRLIKEREKALLQTSGKMLVVVDDKVSTMQQGELTQNNVPNWYRAVAQTEREVLGLGKEEDGKEQQQNKPIEVKFDSAFEELCKKKEDE